MKVLVCGSRDWDNASFIHDSLAQLPKDAEVIEGGARGADEMARQSATELGLDVVEYPANWERFGNSAGPLRNIKMLDREQPDLVIAFQANNSKGTQHMIDQAKRRGIRVELHV